MNAPTIQLVLRLSQDGDLVRLDISSLGDLHPTQWDPARTTAKLSQPGQVTGPSYYSTITLPGKLPTTIPQEAVDEIGTTARKALQGTLARLVING